MKITQTEKGTLIQSSYKMSNRQWNKEGKPHYWILVKETKQDKGVFLNIPWIRADEPLNVTVPDTDLTGKYITIGAGSRENGVRETIQVPPKEQKKIPEEEI